MARLIADLPKLKAAVDTDDPPTVRGYRRTDYQTQLKASLVLVTNKRGRVLADLGADPATAALVAQQPGARRERCAGARASASCRSPNGILQVVTVPIAIGRAAPEMLGTLSVGFLLDDALAAPAESDHRQRGRVRHGRPDPRGDAAARSSGRRSRICSAPPASSHAAARRRGLRGASAAAGAVRPAMRRRAGAGRADPALAHRTAAVPATPFTPASASPRCSRSRLATLLSFAVARTITRPLAAITDVMREVAATGDLTRKIALRAGNRWDDEDARLLATTFNTLTDSIARFQREMSQKERLSSLGRLSTVIAHEIRNPLMIIKAALHSLRQPGVEPRSRARGDRRHRRRGRAAQPDRQRSARLRAADPLRIWRRSI